VNDSDALDLAALLYRAEELRIPPQDVERILKHVETYTVDATPAALNDLDCDYRVGACMVGDEWLYNGERMGAYKGRMVLYWAKGGRRG